MTTLPIIKDIVTHKQVGRETPWTFRIIRNGTVIQPGYPFSVSQGLIRVGFFLCLYRTRLLISMFLAEKSDLSI